MDSMTWELGGGYSVVFCSLLSVVPIGIIKAELSSDIAIVNTGRPSIFASTFKNDV